MGNKGSKVIDNCSDIECLQYFQLLIYLKRYKSNFECNCYSLTTKIDLWSMKFTTKYGTDLKLLMEMVEDIKEIVPNKYTNVSYDYNGSDLIIDIGFTGCPEFIINRYKELYVK